MICEKCNKKRITLSGLCCDCKFNSPVGLSEEEVFKKYNQLEGLDLIREKVRKRDNYICRDCKRKWEIGDRRFDVHHLDENQSSKREYKYDKNNMNKTITICHPCHMKIPKIKRK